MAERTDRLTALRRLGSQDKTRRVLAALDAAVGAGEPLSIAALQDDEVVGVSHQHRSARRHVRPVRVAAQVADSGGFFHPVQRNVQQQRADHPTLRSALLSRGEPALLDHASSQPPGDHAPPGEGAEVSQQPLVVDAVERR